jgi:cell wall-associated NlpC family hydrolase
MLQNSIFGLLVFILVITSCDLKKEPPESFTTGIEKIKETWAPDKRLAVFDVDWEYKDGKWYITGETSVTSAGQAVESLTKDSFADGEYQVNIDFLPSAEMGDTTYALVNVSVGNLRRSPKHAAEMVDQVLMGMELKLLKTKSYWYLVQTPYQYIGWITRGTIKRISSDDRRSWHKADKHSLTINFTQVYGSPSHKSQVVCDLVLGSTVIRKSIRDQWAEIELPDGRVGYVKRSDIKPFQPLQNTAVLNRMAIVNRAKQMMGIPYLWGGNSTKGLDCSGFSGTVFKSEGLQLPRDANMQVKLGKEITPDANYSNILPGDLIFFGPPDRITHVGICLGGSYFIHSSGDVHINSLDEKDVLFNAYRKNTLRHIKRIIQN